MSVKILQGDVIAQLKTIDAESVDCVVTSPPYWGMRNYGVDGQYGQETTLGEHLEIMLRVFAEVRRVMKPEASLWLNYGDCYASAPNGRSAADTKTAGNDDRTFRDKPFSTVGPVYPPEPGKPFGTGIKRRGGGNNPARGCLKPKDLCMAANRLAIVLQENGWWVRAECVWGKPNAMPRSSGRWRPSENFEKVWLLSKTGKMYYDAPSVRMPAADASISRWEQDIEGQCGSDRAVGKTNGKMKAVGGPTIKEPDNWDTGPGAHGSAHRKGRQKGNVKTDKKRRGHERPHAGFSKKWDKMTKAEQQANGRLFRNFEPDLTPILPHQIWQIATQGFSEAHFATFPEALVTPCILAGCPANGIVLDPFAGAGTTGLVAEALGRDSIMIELNDEYCDLMARRIRAGLGQIDDYPQPIMEEGLFAEAAE